MKFLMICSSFSGERLTQNMWSKIEDLAFDKYVDVDGVIITKEEYKIQGLTTYDFNNKDNINFAFYWLLKNLDMKKYDAVMLVDVKYLNDLDTLGKMFDLLLDGKNIVHVQKKHSSLYNFFNYGLLKFSNAMNRMLLGTKESGYIKNFVAFDRSIIELLQEFPHKCGFVKETAYFTNTDTEIIYVDPKYQKARMEKFNPTGYILSGVEAGLAFTSFMLAIWLPLNLNSILWLIILTMLLSIASVLHFSITNVNRIVRLSKLKETPNIITTISDQRTDLEREKFSDIKDTTQETHTEKVKVKKPKTTNKKSEVSKPKSTNKKSEVSKPKSTNKKTDSTKNNQKKSIKKDGNK